MTYEYVCESCDIQFEAFHKTIQASERKDPTRCPTCKKKPKRLISLSRVVFVDKPTDRGRWERKEIKHFGTHGDLGNAEKVRVANQKATVDAEREKVFYNHNDTPSAPPVPRKSREEVKEGRRIIKEMLKR